MKPLVVLTVLAAFEAIVLAGLYRSNRGLRVELGSAQFRAIERDRAAWLAASEAQDAEERLIDSGQTPAVVDPEPDEIVVSGGAPA